VTILTAALKRKFSVYRAHHLQTLGFLSAVLLLGNWFGTVDLVSAKRENAFAIRKGKG
jgi:hypothetical protein